MKTRTQYLSTLAVQAPLPQGARACEIDEDGSVCHGYELAGGELVVLAVVLRSAAAQTAFDAENTAAAQETTKRQAAVTVVRNQVARVKAIAPGARTEQDRWLLALSFLVLREE